MRPMLRPRSADDEDGRYVAEAMKGESPPADKPTQPKPAKQPKRRGRKVDTDPDRRTRRLPKPGQRDSTRSTRTSTPRWSLAKGERSGLLIDTNTAEAAGIIRPAKPCQGYSIIPARILLALTFSGNSGLFSSGTGIIPLSNYSFRSVADTSLVRLTLRRPRLDMEYPR